MRAGSTIGIGAALLFAACVGGEPGAAGGGEAEPAAYRWQEIGLSAEAAATLGRWGFMTADRGDGTAILFGGTRLDAVADGESFGDSWIVDGRPEAPIFRRLETAGDPGPRYCGCASYDPVRDIVVLVGGRDVGMIMPETWILDLATSAWTRLDVEGTPPGVVACAMAYSREGDATFLFGGMGGERGTDVYDGTWRLDADVPAWTELEARGPSARFSAILTPVAPGEPLLLFGGAPSTFGVEYLADVWRFDAIRESWSPLVVEGPRPPGRREAWLAVEPRGTGIVLGMGAAGVQASDVLSDLWRLDLATGLWTDVTPPRTPPGRGFSLYLPGGPGRIGLLLGGFDNIAPVPDLHRLLPPEGDPRW